jgi:hypothetical protein
MSIQDILTFLRNYKNNNFKKKLPTTSQSPSSLSASSSTTTATSVSHALEDAIRGLVVLESDLTPRDLFFLQHPDGYTKALAEIKMKMPPGTASVALVQKARKWVWEVADKQMWERRKQSLEQDAHRQVPIFPILCRLVIDRSYRSNQTLWPKLVRESLQQNLSRGVVGTTAVGLMYVFRTKSGGIQHGM